MPAKFTNIISEKQLDSIFETSFQRPVAVLKHSDTCGISADILYQLREIDGEINVIVIQEHRDISNSLAHRTGHRHQSPQAFVIKDGKSVYHATHYGINPAEIEKMLSVGPKSLSVDI
ncbi:MAG: bacillithiol system redox-active protein YtxJ [Pyrinomonadaceae bacterium]